MLGFVFFVRNRVELGLERISISKEEKKRGSADGEYDGKVWSVSMGTRQSPTPLWEPRFVSFEGVMPCQASSLQILFL
jgi:hypothetical protein